MTNIFLFLTMSFFTARCKRHQKVTYVQMYGTNIHDAVQYKRKTKTQTHIKFGKSALYETLVNRLSRIRPADAVATQLELLIQPWMCLCQFRHHLQVKSCTLGCDQRQQTSSTFLTLLRDVNSSHLFVQLGLCISIYPHR